MNKIAFLVVAAGLAVGVSQSVFGQGGAAPQEPQARQVVTRADDLPTHLYKLELKPSELLAADDAKFDEFMRLVKLNITTDLKELDIQDKTTLRDMHSLLAQIALLEGDADAVRSNLAIARQNELKESTKLMMGHIPESMLIAKASAGTDQAKYAQIFEETLVQRWGALPWDKVQEDIKRQKGRAEMITRDLVLGQVSAGLDPVWEKQEGTLSDDFAHGLVSMRLALTRQLELNPSIAKVASAIIDKNAVERVDNWTPTLATLTGNEGGKPVVVAVWDSGIDAPVFSSQLWTNPKEQANARDDDGNGFIDDVHGIAFDLREQRASDLLHPVTDMHNDPALVKKHTKGLMDLQANIDSPERQALVGYLRGLKQDQAGSFMEDLGLYGNHSHGTHVAGISLQGNPYAQLLGVRITFDYKNIPQITPTEEMARRMAQNYKDTVAYMKAAGVRVVNMSWGGSKQDVEAQLEQTGVGKDSAERDAIARKLFDIGKQGLQEAIESAPEILFVAAAGNSDNNNAFVEFVPSGLNLPNLITVGAIDSSGKPTGFTTFGSNVTLYANGFEVDSYVPGGERMKFSGTSMAAPQVTNLAGKLFALKPDLTVAQAINVMKQSADPMIGQEGRLIINQKKAIAQLGKAGGN